MPSTSTTQILSDSSSILSAHSTLISRVRASQRTHRHNILRVSESLSNLPLIPSPPPSPLPSPRSDSDSSPTEPPSDPRLQRPDLPPAKRARVVRYKNYVPEEETIRNDYSQRYVDSGDWPQNWVIGAEPERRFEEYPKQQRLLALKKASVAAYSLPPMWLPFAELSSLTSPPPHSSPSHSISSLPPNPSSAHPLPLPPSSVPHPPHPLPLPKFDVILLDPPYSSSFSWPQLQDLPVPALAADPSFVFLWVGSGAGDGLERGREVLARWGYRRCEDVVWVKTNKETNRGAGTDPPTTSLLTRTKQHCLIGIRGTVRRSTDSWFVHCNVDTDVLIWPGDPTDPTRKPPEMHTLIENFCLGTRRLELFARARGLRRGWLSVLSADEESWLSEAASSMYEVTSASVDAVRWDREKWETDIRELAMRGAGGAPGGKYVVPMTPEIEALRPKSPFRPGAAGAGGGNPGLGGGIGIQGLNSGGGMVMQGMGMGGMGGMNKGRPMGGTQNLNTLPRSNQGMGQNQMQMQPMMGAGMGGPGMGMGNMNLGMGMNQMNMMGMNQMGGMGMGVGNMNNGMDMMGMGQMGMPQMGPMGGMGMDVGGWPGMGMNMNMGGSPMGGTNMGGLGMGTHGNLGNMNMGMRMGGGIRSGGGGGVSGGVGLGINVGGEHGHGQMNNNPARLGMSSLQGQGQDFVDAGMWDGGRMLNMGMGMGMGEMTGMGGMEMGPWGTGGSGY